MIIEFFLFFNFTSNPNGEENSINEAPLWLPFELNEPNVLILDSVMPKLDLNLMDIYMKKKEFWYNYFINDIYNHCSNITVNRIITVEDGSVNNYGLKLSSYASLFIIYIQIIFALFIFYFF